MTNKSKTLYTGVTSDLLRRVFEHKHELVEGFTKQYNITKLIWFEEFDNPKEAIDSEKRIKGWVRKKKILLIESKNPHWEDLSEDWFRDSSALPQNDIRGTFSNE
jgi:putative endonuclease